MPKGFNFEIEGGEILLLVAEFLEILNYGYLEIKPFRPIPTLPVKSSELSKGERPDIQY